MNIWYASDVKVADHKQLATQEAKCQQTMTSRGVILGKRFLKHSAFTLVEILIATTLMAALLVALWRLVGIYTSLRDKGDLHAGQVGNVSVIMQQLEEDLRELPEVPTQASRERELPTHQHPAPLHRERSGVQQEVLEFENSYDDNPAVETLSEAAITLERLSQQEDGGNPETDRTSAQDDSYHASSPYDPHAYARSNAFDYDSHAEGGIDQAAGCLVGDHQSLTITNLDCANSQPSGKGSEQDSYQSLSDSENSHETQHDKLSNRPTYGVGRSSYGPARAQPVSRPSGLGEGRLQGQMPVRYVRYWLAGVMPLVAQSTGTGSSGVSSENAEIEGLGLSDAGKGTEVSGVALGSGTEERASGLYREEVVGVSAPVEMRTLRGSAPGENSDFDDMGSIAGMSDSSGMESLDSVEETESILRRSSHLAQVEWAKFRYFDGNQWKSAWDSRLQGELPVAIEMSLWLLRRNGNGSSRVVKPQESPTVTSESEWSEVDTMGEAGRQLPLAMQTLPEDEFTDTELSSSAGDDDPMERQPEVRQLVVLRTALSGDGLPEDSELPQTHGLNTTTGLEAPGGSPFDAQRSSGAYPDPHKGPVFP